MAKKPNICQYWIEEEPIQCDHWNAESRKCTYESDINGIVSSYYPGCNGIGTAAGCNHYVGEGFEARCILPDPGRHVCNRETGEKWTVEQISGYNDGKCDENGTDTTCLGYSPYHMAFSELKPTRDESIDSDSFSTIDEIGYRLPLNYEVYNARAQLSKCYWWDGEIKNFWIDDDSGAVMVTGPTKCICPDEATKRYRQYEFDKGTGTVSPPCNGAKPECPCYTGVCWIYCVDEKMRLGDKVLAEQILELRYYLRRENWTGYTFNQAFGEPSIKAWGGNVYTQFDENQTAINWVIDAIRTYIPSFEKFSIEYKKELLTAGTPVDNEDNYPTLVKEIKDLPLPPLIRSKFDQNEAGENIFEATKWQHKYVLIVGDLFYYGSEAYGINLNDPDLAFLGAELKDCDSMDEIRANYDQGEDPEGFEKFYNELDCALNWLIKYTPDKVGYSLSTAGTNSFSIKMPASFGDNEIVVFDKGSGTWEYSKICLKKLLCNGVIGQTGFSVEDETNNTVSYLPFYESDFSSYINGNGLVTFQFFSFLSEGSGASVDYIYNDGVRKRLDANPAYPAGFDTYEMCYELFKIKVFDRMELDLENVKIFGNTGNALVIIPDENKQLTNVIKLWEVEGDIILSVTGSDGEAYDVDMTICDREENIDRLEVNQILIEPKDISKWRQACDAKLKIGPVYTYEKISFGEEPDSGDYEEVRESFLAEEDVVDYRDTVNLKVDENRYSLTDFGTEALMISVVFKGITGRVRGQTKTNMVTWIRQQYCRDVEINYSWKRPYQMCVLQPEMSCYGTPSLRCQVDTEMGGLVPPCGDHDLSVMSGRWPMWYPYEECDNVARWNTTGFLTEWDIRIMDCFWEGKHGYWDMRMLGPDKQDARTCEMHAQLWDCTCDWSFCNYYQKGENLFTGWGRYRGGVTGSDKFDLVKNDGSLPKFGNVYRDFLRSYRSMDNIDYYYFNGRSYQRRRKWVPVPEFYGFADVTRDTSEFPYRLYSSNDYYSDGASFVHPFGLMITHSDIENVMIDEKVDSDDGGRPNRYRFEDIFRVNYSFGALYYPYPKSPYFKMINNQLVPLIAWYTYKDYPGEGGGADTSIQWACQEIWEEIKSHTFSV
jgi:hypothetical protein